METHSIVINVDGKTYYIDAEVDVFLEHFGADADGRRGLFVDNWELSSYRIEDENFKQIKTDEISKELEYKILNEINTELEKII